jgi:hypothetical protein
MEYWSDGVLECWSVGRISDLEKFFISLLHYSSTPLIGLNKKPLESVLWTFGDLA